MSVAQTGTCADWSRYRFASCEQAIPVVTTFPEAQNRTTQTPLRPVEGLQRDADTVVNTFQPEDADRNLDFDALVAKYERKIFNVIYRLIGDYEEATDLTQETFISAFKHYDKFRGESKVFTWLYQIARNLCINRIRQRDRQRVLRVESLDQPRESLNDDGMTLEVPDWTHSPQNVLEDKELRERIMTAIESLPPDYREVVVLREFQNLSYNEIVEVTGLTLENVKTRLSRARGMLRRKLEPYYRHS